MKTTAKRIMPFLAASALMGSDVQMPERQPKEKLLGRATKRSKV